MQVQLGNNAAKEGYRLPGDDTLYHRALEGDQVTTVVIPDSYTLAEAFLCVTAPDGVWTHHSQADPDGKVVPPAWVDSDMPGLAELIASNYPGTAVGRPAETADEAAPAQEA